MLLPDADLRQEVYEALRPMNRHGSEYPKRLGAFGLVGAMVQGGLPCRTVPEEFWNVDVTDEGYAVASICCPCGSNPVVELGAYPESCRCQRWFLYTGTEVLALNTPSA